MAVPRIVQALMTIAAFAFANHLSDISVPFFAPTAAHATHAPTEGFGATTSGGAGTTECVVSSLADHGTGTLRECLSQGHRYVTFRVAGTIVLHDWLYVMGPHVTIDGFSAPAPGITITGWGLAIYRNVPKRAANAHDVIVRGLRFRDVAPMSGSGDCISILGDTFNVVIDHVSVAGCGDGAIDVSTGPRDVTIQWSILSTYKVSLIGTTSSGGKLTERVSLHHNFFAAGDDRFPLVRSTDTPARDTTVDIRQNIFRGWLRANGTKIETGTWVNLVGNTYIPRTGTTLRDAAGSVQISSSSRTYTAGNVELLYGSQYNGYGTESAALPAPRITPRPAGCVVSHAGVHPRDDVDQEFVHAVRDLVAPCPEPAPQPTQPVVSPQPDLVPRSLEAPGTATAGQSFSVRATIANLGTASTVKSTARYHLVSGSTKLELGAFDVPSLSPGASHTATTTVTLPAGAGAGSYSLQVHADADGVVAESNEMNNTLAIGLTVSSPAPAPSPSPSSGSSLPDLVIVDPRGPYNAVRGVRYSVEFKVKNVGTAAAAASEVRLYVSSDKHLSGDDVQLLRVPVPALGPGAVYTSSRLTVTIPTSVKVGAAKMLFMVDPLGVVSESDETNNLRTRDLQIQ